MKSIILDIDPGIDDAVGLLLALNNRDLEVLAVTTVSGNVDVRQATINALRIIEASGKKVSVFAGAARPLRKRATVSATNIHGRDGLGETDLLPLVPTRRPEEANAVDMLLDLLKTRKKKEDISIVATGPLTNIGMLFKKDPFVTKNLKIFIMGGIYDLNVRGNISKHAEFNFYVDPDAADIVIRSGNTAASTGDGGGGASIVASGLDITTNPYCAVGPEMFSKICAIKSSVAQAACKLLSYPVRKFGYFHLHDVFALYSLVHPEIFTREEYCVRVDTEKYRGRCAPTASQEGGGNVQVCRKVDHDLFNRHLLADLLSDA